MKQNEKQRETRARMWWRMEKVSELYTSTMIYSHLSNALENLDDFFYLHFIFSKVANKFCISFIHSSLLFSLWIIADKIPINNGWDFFFIRLSSFHFSYAHRDMLMIHLWKYILTFMLECWLRDQMIRLSHIKVYSDLSLFCPHLL